MSDEMARQLILENIRLKKSKIAHCRGCINLKKHPCNAFYFCPKLGAVDPDVDGYSKRVSA